MADNKKYYVFCGSHCMYEAMTKEQTLAAIEQAVSGGQIKDVDTGFITKIKEQNKNVGLKIWVGTQAEYNAIETKENNCFYVITDDTDKEDIETAIENLQREMNTLNEYVGALNQPVVLYEGELQEGDTVTIEGFEKYSLFAVEYQLRAGDFGRVGRSTIVLAKEIIDKAYDEMGTEMLRGGNLHFVSDADKFRWYACTLLINNNVVNAYHLASADWGATNISHGVITKITGIA